MAEQEEVPVNNEIVKKSPEVRIILQRHGETDRTRPAPDGPLEERERAGWLTPKGVEDTREVARRKVEEILAEGKPVTFFFLHSPSAWFSQGLEYGKRAEQTAVESAAIVDEVITERGMTPENAEVASFKKSERGSRPEERLAEPDLYYVYGSDNPTGYHEAMKEKYGQEGWEEGFHQMEADMEEVRKKVGAKSSADQGEMVVEELRVLERFSHFYNMRHPGRLQVYWLDTHGDKLRSTLQHGIGAGEDVNGYAFATAEMLDLSLENGVLRTSFKDKEYSLDLNPNDN